ncbi:uncharacterized protein LOC131151951 [Malania oleifera]|uniref:uncharacterized protein LOC131151951 n=1 Tax=Malania oleifera TaxID=397392 RepID=UPI0025AE6044|nr:uncharacterized protein LOC131151951 [Malania oleifera]
MNQTRETLLAEVRFLRRRRRYLLKIQSPKPEAEQEVVQRQNSDVHSELPVKKRKYSVNNEAAVENPCPVMDINQTPGGDWEPLLVEKMPKSCLFSGKKVGKKKISWQDPVALEV